MSTQLKPNPSTESSKERPTYNFEAVRALLTSLKAAVSQANLKGCYTLDEAASLKRSFDLLNQVVETTDQYQTGKVPEDQKEMPVYNFEAVKALLTSLKAALNQANQKGSYTLDEAASLKRSFDLLGQVIDTTELHQVDKTLKDTSVAKETSA
jgi:predicted nuclease with TOPRIM domain